MQFLVLHVDVKVALSYKIKGIFLDVGSFSPYYRVWRTDGGENHNHDQGLHTSVIPG